MNATIIYLEDIGDNKIQVSVEAIGDPEQSLVLCNKVMTDILESPQTKLLRSSVFTRPHNRVQ